MLKSIENTGKMIKIKFLFGKLKNLNKSLQQKINNLLKRRKMFVFKSLPQSNSSVGAGVAVLRGLTQS